MSLVPEAWNNRIGSTRSSHNDLSLDKSYDSADLDVCREECLRSCEMREYNLAPFEIPEVLHVGTSAVIVGAHDRERGRYIVLKAFLNKARQDLGEFAHLEYMNELTILQRLRASSSNSYLHHYIPICYGYGVLKDQPAFVLEPLVGSMRDVIDFGCDPRHSNLSSRCWQNSWNEEISTDWTIPTNPCEKLCCWLLWSQQMAEALHFVHGSHVIHNDVKPEHFMFRSLRKAKNLVLVDFTNAQILHSDDGNHPMCSVGTPPYMAPEKYGNGYVTEKVDIWALGFILLELYSGGDAGSFNIHSHRDNIRQWCRDRTAPSVPNTLCDGIMNEVSSWVNYVVRARKNDITNLQKCRQLEMDVKSGIISVVFDCLKLEPSSRPTGREIADTFTSLLHKSLDLFTGMKCDFSNTWEENI